jgi:hypothetical protein
MFAPPMADVAAGTALLSWPAAVATDEPTALTVLPMEDATGATGLVLPDGGGEPAADARRATGSVRRCARIVIAHGLHSRRLTVRWREGLGARPPAMDRSLRSVTGSVCDRERVCGSAA